MKRVYCEECGQMVPADENDNPLPHDCAGSFDEDELNLRPLDFDQ